MFGGVLLQGGVGSAILNRFQGLVTFAYRWAVLVCSSEKTGVGRREEIRV